MATVVSSVTENGLFLSLEQCVQLGLQPGDSVELRSDADAASETERQLEIAKRIMVERHDMLERLAEQIMEEDAEVLRRLAE